ncbi:MAG TPA: hypothetical protein VFU21_22010, partial [Kofleriaceae bacterium]|nr:hypothetical protein [Kofleriaceae bacterium]
MTPTAAALPAAAASARKAEPALGVVDRGIFSDLDPRVQLALPAAIAASEVEAVVDPGHRMLVLYRAGWPIKVYPLGGPEEVAIGDLSLTLRPGDRD